MNKIKARYAFGLLVLLVSFVFLLWGLWPVGRQSRSTPVSLDEILSQGVSSEGLPIPALISEEREMHIEWPSRMRLGDVGSIRLSLEPVLTNSTGATVANVSNTPQNIFAEARLEMAGMQYSPAGEISQLMSQGQTMNFLWSVRPTEAGTYRGTIWLYVRYDPPGADTPIRRVLSAQRLKIEAVDLMGMNAGMARVLGSIGLVVSLILLIDGLLSWLEALTNRLRSRNDPT